MCRMSTEVAIKMMNSEIREEFCGRGSFGIRLEEFDVKGKGERASEAARLSGKKIAM